MNVRDFKELAILEGGAQEYFDKLHAIETRVSAGSEDERGDDRPYQVHEGVAIIPIKGPLYQSVPGWARDLFGVSGYNLIRDDITIAIEDEEVERILLHMNTPGGAVAGVSGASEVIARAGTIKPIDVFGEGTVASAGYWLASAANGKFNVSKETKVGSIGVIVTHVSMQKALEDIGYKVTEVKSDKLKAVGGPYKDLTKEDKAYIQKMVSQMHTLFKEHVFGYRPQVPESAMKGEAYIASEALSYSLVDGIMVFDDAVTESVNAVPEGGDTVKIYTRAQLDAALSEGAVLDELEVSADLQEELEAEAADVEQDAATIEDEEAVEGEAAAEGEEAAEEPEEPEESSSGDRYIRLLEKDIENLKAKNIDLETEKRILEGAAANHEKTVAGLREIVEESLNRKRVALGMQSMEFGEYSVESLLREHAVVSKEFNKSMRIGGVAPRQKAEESGKVISISSYDAGSLGAAQV